MPRNLYDYYPTPYALADAVLANLAATGANPKTILDVGAGSGVFGTAARSWFPNAHITGIELRNEPHPAAYDTWYAATDALLCELPKVDAIIGNPPYDLAEPILRRVLPQLNVAGCALFVLRLSFLGSVKREAFWNAHPAAEVSIIVPRPSFTADGKTDAAEYALFRWNASLSRYPYQNWLRWKKQNEVNV
ncbi:hypothetical protein EYB53_018130 [Candidatus Chloroploca sp. M-50]|uniref:Methyltransferase n=1 Tax=Candidatus Chloroploca mongolica TaxID=2528176 RepID=A0ABS4DDY2_9CHLR|nr:hypothetical protein [Candidatus Chloroploca mongolica]MBP1467638.1 hypothetical protein [Candidatus Chloroploca mongolica]